MTIQAIEREIDTHVSQLDQDMAFEEAVEAFEDDLREQLGCWQRVEFRYRAGLRAARHTITPKDVCGHAASEYPDQMDVVFRLLDSDPIEAQRQMRELKIRAINDLVNEAPTEQAVRHQRENDDEI